LILFLVLYAVSIAALLVALAARGQRLTSREANILRIVLAALSTVFAIVGLIGFIDLVREPEHSPQDSSLGFAAFGALAVGGVTYTVGAALWNDAGFVLRLSGWVLMVLALALPSQLMLGLPLACTLAVGLQRDGRAQTGGWAGHRAPTLHRGFDRRAL
jgi:ABC-type sugar transport system permease subunit